MVSVEGLIDGGTGIYINFSTENITTQLKHKQILPNKRELNS